MRPFSAIGLALSAIGFAPTASTSAELITFPVGTQVHYNAQNIWWVDHPPFTFSRWGGLSINTWNTVDIHPGGLSVAPLYVDGPRWLSINANGDAFSLERFTAIETPGSLSAPTGLRLIVTAYQAGTGDFFEAELPFDLNVHTYDTWDLLAADERFAAVTSAAIDIETPYVDPDNYAYILDTVTAGLIAPDCPEDINGDGVIDLNDLSVLLIHFGTASGAAHADGDIDGDGDVELSDLSMLLAEYGTTCG